MNATVPHHHRRDWRRRRVGTRQFSPRTVKHHLRNVFTKLGISSCNQLHVVLASDLATAGSLQTRRPLGLWVLRR